MPFENWHTGPISSRSRNEDIKLVAKLVYSTTHCTLYRIFSIFLAMLCHQSRSTLAVWARIISCCTRTLAGRCRILKLGTPHFGCSGWGRCCLFFLSCIHAEHQEYLCRFEYRSSISFDIRSETLLEDPLRDNEY